MSKPQQPTRQAEDERAEIAAAREALAAAQAQLDADRQAFAAERATEPPLPFLSVVQREALAASRAGDHALHARLENLAAAAGLLRFKIADGPEIPEGPARDAVDRLLAVL